MSKELIWAAGLFEGEGCFSYHNKGTGQFYAIMTNCDLDVVQRFHKAVWGMGSINGPYHGPKKTHKPQYRWRCGKFEECQALIAAFWDYLGVRRKAKATELLTKAKEYRNAK